MIYFLSRKLNRQYSSQINIKINLGMEKDMQS